MVSGFEQGGLNSKDQPLSARDTHDKTKPQSVWEQAREILNGEAIKLSHQFDLSPAQSAKTKTEQASSQKPKASKLVSDLEKSLPVLPPFTHSVHQQNNPEKKKESTSSQGKKESESASQPNNLLQNFSPLKDLLPVPKAGANGQGAEQFASPQDEPSATPAPLDRFLHPTHEQNSINQSADSSSNPFSINQSAISSSNPFKDTADSVLKTAKDDKTRDTSKDTSSASDKFGVAPPKLDVPIFDSQEGSLCPKGGNGKVVDPTAPPASNPATPEKGQSDPVKANGDKTTKDPAPAPSPIDSSAGKQTDKDPAKNAGEHKGNSGAAGSTTGDLGNGIEHGGTTGGAAVGAAGGSNGDSANGTDHSGSTTGNGGNGGDHKGGAGDKQPTKGSDPPPSSEGSKPAPDKNAGAAKPPEGSASDSPTKSPGASDPANGGTDKHPTSSEPANGGDGNKPPVNNTTDTKPTSDPKPTGSDTKPVEVQPSAPIQKTGDSGSDGKKSDPAPKPDAGPPLYAKSPGSQVASDPSAGKDILVAPKQPTSFARTSVDASQQVDLALQKLLYAKGSDAPAEKTLLTSEPLAGDKKQAIADGNNPGQVKALADGRLTADGKPAPEGKLAADGKLIVEGKQGSEVKALDNKISEGKLGDLRIAELKPVDIKTIDLKPGETIRDNKTLAPEIKGELQPPRRQDSPQAKGDQLASRVDGASNEPQRIFGGKAGGDDATNKSNSTVADWSNNNNQPLKGNDPSDPTRKEATTKHSTADVRTVDGSLIPFVPIVANGGSDYTGIGKGGGKPISGAGANTKKQTGRRKYTVKFGDTLEIIATRILKDVRFASLLMTINRSTLKLIYKGLRQVVDLKPGDQIWLPSDAEMDLHSQAFFADHVSSADAQLDHAPLANQNDQVSQAFVKTQSRQEAAAAAIPQGHTWVSVSKITDTCQILIADPGNTDTVFSIRLQLRANGQWVTIAAYESHFGNNIRYIYRQDGSRIPFKMDLPAEIIKSMAKEDFASHWQSYEKAFVLNDLKYL